MFVKRRRILHCVLMISARHFLRIWIQRFTVVTSSVIVSSLISHGCWKENIRQENKRGINCSISVVHPVSPERKKWIAISTERMLFVWKRPQEAGVIHRWFGVVADRACCGAIKERTRKVWLHYARKNRWITPASTRGLVTWILS